MPTYVFAMFLILGFVLVAIAYVNLKDKWAPRTIDNWKGRDVCRDLTPSQAAVLLKRHPSEAVALEVASLLLEDKLEILSLNPVRIRFKESRYLDETGKLIKNSLDGEGSFKEGAAIGIMEHIYSKLNDKMASFSGRKTALFYRQFPIEGWKTFFSGGGLKRDDVPWLLLREPGAVWKRLKKNEFGEMMIHLYRIIGLFVMHLVDDKELHCKVAVCSGGLFWYRKDLVTGVTFYETPDLFSYLKTASEEMAVRNPQIHDKLRKVMKDFEKKSGGKEPF